MVKPAQSSKIMEFHMEVHPERCKHELSDASYNDRDDLSLLLDCGGNKEIMELMKILLTPNDLLQVWRSCHGGVDSALGLMFHLASNRGTTLEEFWAISSSHRFDDVSEIIEDEVRRSPSIANKKLDNQKFCLLTKIAEIISERPNSRRTPWKTIASSMGLTNLMIVNLDSPSYAGRKSGSLTMSFISYMTMAYPTTKVAEIAQGLVEIGCSSEVAKQKMFENCRKEGCISNY